jgi:hypothetical protein
MGCILTACTPANRQEPDETVAPPVEVAAQWEAFRGDFIDGYLAAQPHRAVALGLHEFDGVFPDWSEDGIERWKEWLREAHSVAQSFEGSILDRSSRFERAYLLAWIEADLFWLEDLDWPKSSPHYYASAFDPSVYFGRPYAPLEVRMEAYVRLAEGIPEAAARVRGNLSGPMPRARVQTGFEMFSRLVELVESGAPRVFDRVTDTNLQERFRRANAAAVGALTAVVADFAARAGSEAEDDFSVGSEMLGKLVWVSERLRVDLTELEGVGEQDLRRTTRALEIACRELDGDASLADCIEVVRGWRMASHPALAVQSDISELRRHLGQAGLVTVPNSAGVTVDEGIWIRWPVVAMIDLPGPFEDDGVSATLWVAGEASEDAHDVNDSGGAEPGDPGFGAADLLLASAAAVWPGRYLMSLHTNGAESEIGRAFIGSGLAEGWAHYSEELTTGEAMGEDDLHIRAAQLLGVLFQDVRFLVTIGLHSGEMNLEEAKALFRERAFLDDDRASDEAVRCAAEPALLKASLGRLFILRLREDWLAAREGAGDLLDFHDALLSHGGPPLGMLREIMVPGVHGSAF